MTHEMSATHGSCSLITVSDSRISSTDASGDTIEQKLIGQGHLVANRSIVPDDIDASSSYQQAEVALVCATALLKPLRRLSKSHSQGLEKFFDCTVSVSWDHELC